MAKYLFPQEIEVLYILPAIRRMLALEMKAKGLEQKKIAELLLVTEAAVSQYINSKRATKVDFTPKVIKAIKDSAKKIINKTPVIKETEVLLKLSRQEKITCQMHRKLSDINKDCKICFN